MNTEDNSMTEHNITIHEVSKVFPLLNDEDLQRLVEDIRKNGLREAIVTHNGAVIDGQNRLRACKLAGVEPRFVEWDGKGNLVDYVVSKNLARRHLTTSQRAMIALKLEPYYSQAARERQEATRAKPGEKVGENVPAKLPEPGESREKAAKIMKVSPRSVSNAKRIAKTSPELAEKVSSGDMTLGAAMSKASLTPEKKSTTQPLAEFLGTLKPAQRRTWMKMSAKLSDTLRRGVLFGGDKCDHLLEYYLAKPLLALLTLQPKGPIHDFVQATLKLVDYLADGSETPGAATSQRDEIDRTLQSIAVASGERRCAYSPADKGWEPGDSRIDPTLPYPACQGDVRWGINSADNNAVPRFLCDAHKEWAEKTSNSVFHAYSTEVTSE